MKLPPKPPLSITLGDLLAAARYCEQPAELVLTRDRDRDTWTLRLLGVETRGFGSAEDALVFAGTVIGCYLGRV